MAKYINKFDTLAEYNAEKDNLDYPSINYVVETDSLEYYTPTPTPSYETQYLTFVAREDGTFKFSKAGLSYSLDNGETWTTLAKNTNSPTVQSGSTIMWKGNLSSSLGVGTFSSTGEFDAEGNIMSLLYGDNFSGQTSLAGKDFAFYWLFTAPYSTNSAKIVNAENLVLPATTLSEGCYGNMFDSCISLTTAPELPATTLASNCYYGMFSGCTSLNYVKCLATDISAEGCTSDWLNNVAASGTFVKAASMNDWTSGNNGIPSGWTVQNYSE